MIIRVMGEGQYTVDDAHADLLNGLDDALERAVEAGDEDAFRTTLGDLLAQVRALGEPLPDDSLEPSDALLPAADSSLADVRVLLADTTEGLIPG